MARKYHKPKVKGVKKTLPTRANKPLARSVNDGLNPAGATVGNVSQKPRAVVYKMMGPHRPMPSAMQ